MDPDAVAAPLPRESPPRDDDSPDAGDKDGRKRRHKEKRSHKHKSKEKKRSREKSPALPEGPSVGDGEDDGEEGELLPHANPLPSPSPLRSPKKPRSRGVSQDLHRHAEGPRSPLYPRSPLGDRVRSASRGRDERLEGSRRTPPPDLRREGDKRDAHPARGASRDRYSRREDSRDRYSRREDSRDRYSRREDSRDRYSRREDSRDRYPRIDNSRDTRHAQWLDSSRDGRRRSPLPMRRDNGASRDSWASSRGARAGGGAYREPGPRQRSRTPERNGARPWSQGSPRMGGDRRRSRSPPHRPRDEEQEADAEEEARIAAQLSVAMGGAGPEEDEEQRLIEERRRRRAEILARHRAQGAGGAVAAERPPNDAAMRSVEQPAADAARQPADRPMADAAPQSAGAEPERAPAPRLAAADPSDDEEAVLGSIMKEGDDLVLFRSDEDGDARLDDSKLARPASASGIGEAHDTELERRLSAHEVAAGAQLAGMRAGPGNGAPAAPPPAAPAATDDGSDVDDIFAATPTDVRRAIEVGGRAGRGSGGAGGASAAAGGAAPKGLVDNFDDAEGYYQFQVGEVIGPGYEVFAAHGQGVFSSVLRARDVTGRQGEGGAPPPELAIKVIRSNETMYKAGQMEKVILRKLAEADPAGKRHCVRLLGSFDYRSHLCLVFESLDMNLRELTKRYGRGIGLSLGAVRLYAHQMLVGLYHLQACGVLHADIKPDNILVNAKRTQVKLCDFGSAMFSGDNEITPYLVSRFYRAPEVILGLPYGVCAGVPHELIRGGRQENCPQGDSGPMRGMVPQGAEPRCRVSLPLLRDCIVCGVPGLF
uniref:Protein kinase domain-containing protein n=1 Tax=Auxenochlorella protothecoides TaxID=3075 RepID=A0A1D2AF63_AUXPR